MVRDVRGSHSSVLCRFVSLSLPLATLRLEAPPPVLIGESASKGVGGADGSSIGSLVSMGWSSFVDLSSGTGGRVLLGGLSTSTTTGVGENLGAFASATIILSMPPRPGGAAIGEALTSPLLRLRSPLASSGGLSPPSLFSLGLRSPPCLSSGCLFSSVSSGVPECVLSTTSSFTCGEPPSVSTSRRLE